MPDFILFDLDGTLTDSGPGIINSVRYALDALGVDAPDAEGLKKFIGPGLRTSFMKFCGFDRETAEVAVAKYREYFTVTGIFENKLYPGVPEMLSSLCGNGKSLVLITSKPEVFAKQILEHFDIARRFSFIAGSELNGERSEKAGLIRYAAAGVPGMTAAESIMVGDREHDILGAKAVGLQSVGVLYGYGDESELREAGADYIVKDVPELNDLLLHL
ncbi:MAG: HAD-IA family hydrolase [Firmicutes bacterium]|nr:HAD-IA family hydrolase [Bacillota bacterium]